MWLEDDPVEQSDGMLCEDCRRREVEVLVPVTVKNCASWPGPGGEHGHRYPELLDRVLLLCSICWAMRD